MPMPHHFPDKPQMVGLPLRHHLLKQSEPVMLGRSLHLDSLLGRALAAVPPALKHSLDTA